MNENISFKLNDKAISVSTDAQRPLLWVLRTDLGLTGTKYDCGKGLCGACTVIIDGMEYNLCRCRAHTRIIRAIEDAAQEMKGAS